MQTGAGGAIVELPLDAILDRAVASAPASSHGFGPAEALALARSLGRALPRGGFLGIESARFEAGAPLTGEARPHRRGASDFRASAAAPEAHRARSG